MFISSPYIGILLPLTTNFIDIIIEFNKIQKMSKNVLNQGSDQYFVPECTFLDVSGCLRLEKNLFANLDPNSHHFSHERVSQMRKIFPKSARSPAVSIFFY